MFYVFFNTSWRVGSWTYAEEIFLGSMRAKGNVLITASLWVALMIKLYDGTGKFADWGCHLLRLAEQAAIKMAAEEHVEDMGSSPG
ncbi:Sugar transporter [Penicillium verhagenii]|uniref:Sugar transporter n=1 Tax=Penicillium verhagenii TaxID=1562060 RepID=UPI0025450FE1|nr:Sugar transporter [Penicillium verhagenii]KAJ5934069.1 Sugar transporter [Penicillium verhagenii]